jgi:hypothetical protein
MNLKRRPILTYEWDTKRGKTRFTEGFDTADLKEVKALLDELGVS